MVHVVIIAHSELANSFMHCVEQIFSKKIECLHIVGVNSSDDISSTLNKVQDLISSVSLVADEILILTDIFGATPHNIASQIVVSGRIELLTGLNLPMLIRAISYANTGLLVCTQKAIEGGISGIIHINNEVNDDKESM